MNAAQLDDPFESLESGIYPDWALSLYLPAPSDIVYDAYFHERLFAELARKRRASADGDEARPALRREEPRVIGRLHERGVPPRHGMAVFAYAPYGLLQSWALPEDEPPRLVLGPRLDLQPLRRQLAAHPPALIATADKEEARIFRLLLAEIEELMSMSGEDVKRHHQGGWSSLNYQRREDEHARANLEVVADWLNAADYGFYRRLHLAGPPEARAQLKALLSDSVTRRLGPDLSIPMYLPPGQMAQHLRDELLGVPLKSAMGG